jgi:PAS domain S-box-containing protein
LLREEAARLAAETLAHELERQREQLHVTLSSIGDAVVVTDRAGLVNFINPVASKLSGWPESEALGQPLESVVRLFNEGTKEPVENPVQKVIRQGHVVELANHTVLVGRDGREIPIEDTAAPIRLRGNDVSGAVLVFRDVTEARRAAEARRYLAAIVESSDDAIIGQTLDGRIASWNRGAERLYGYRAEEVVGQPLARLVPPDHPDELHALTLRLLRGESIEHFETERLRKDGARVQVSLTISPVKDAAGRVIGASKIARDITARREEDRRKNEFLALLAHELRNPLAPLRNALQIIRLSGDDRNAVEKSRGLMERQLKHLVRLVDDLLDISRISRGKLHLHKERMPAVTAVRHAMDLCGEIAQTNGHELTVSLSEEPLYVDADKTRLAQAICNLLHNAAKYTDRGGRIRLSLAREGDTAVIRVADTGVGIPPHMLGSIFDMFTQVDRSLEKSQGGLGVGLTIVRRLIELHGGTVEARSEGYGRGSEFVIRLPAVAASPPHIEHPPGESSGPRPASHRVLVVDDNVDAAASLALVLNLMGCEVRVAHDGLAGFDEARAFRPGIIFLDIGMPRLNGYDAARLIRAEDWGRNLTVVALTGWGQPDDRRRSEEAGFDFHLVKPIEPIILENLLANLSEVS